jgi:hypothetical protein
MTLGELILVVVPIILIEVWWFKFGFSDYKGHEKELIKYIFFFIILVANVAVLMIAFGALVKLIVQLPIWSTVLW